MTVIYEGGEIKSGRQSKVLPAETRCKYIHVSLTQASMPATVSAGNTSL